VQNKNPNPNHNIWNNNGTWWCHYTVHNDDYTKKRVRVSLGTDDVAIARALRDFLMQVTQDGTISYSVADEYQGMFAFDLSLTSSALPFTLGELADLLETSKQRGAPGNLIVGFNNHNAEYIGRSTLRHFTSISSEFYPQLARHCEHMFDEWHQEELETEEELL